MEDDLNILYIEGDLNFSVNGRRLQICLLMEDNLNLFVNDNKCLKGRLSELDLSLAQLSPSLFLLCLPEEEK